MPAVSSNTDAIKDFRFARVCEVLNSAHGQVVDLQNINLAIGHLNKLGPFNKLTADSRAANSTSIFVALYGHTSNGHNYIPMAITQGCTLMLCETKKQNENNQVIAINEANQPQVAIQIKVFNLRNKLGLIAKAFYLDARDETLHVKTRVTAVTGTNGKTSVASLIAQWVSLLGETSASIGTLGVKQYKNGASTKIADTINTTPDVISLYEYLSQFQQQGINMLALEASSHGLVQNRLADFEVNCGIFTNLSQDHLDYHQNMNDYGAAKRRLISSPNLRYIALNADDPASNLWRADIQSHCKNNEKQPIQLVWFSVRGESVLNSVASQNNDYKCWASNIAYTQHGCEFTFHSSWGTANVSLSLIGHFNVANFLAAASALLIQGYNFNDLVQQAKYLSGVAGRMELFRATGVHVSESANKPLNDSLLNQQTLLQSRQQRANILVDYAHTPDALKQALIAARAHTNGQLICVFGCGGDRDKSKRAIMGEIADQLADKIMLTQDNSRTELAENIIADIKKGIQALSKVEVQFDRKQAIIHAWQNSQANDLILLAGKGHETYIEMNNQRIDYNERAFVSQLLEFGVNISSDFDSNDATLGGA